MRHGMAGGRAGPGGAMTAVERARRGRAGAHRRPEDGRSGRLAQLHRGGRERDLPVRARRRRHAGAHASSESGAFFEAVALFLILSNTAELGADTGLTRMIPSYRVSGRIADVRRSLARRARARRSSPGSLLAAISFALAAPLAAHLHQPPPRRCRRGRDLHPRPGGVPAAVGAYTVADRRDARLRDDGAQRARRPDRQVGGYRRVAVAVAVIAGGGSFARRGRVGPADRDRVRHHARLAGAARPEGRAARAGDEAARTDVRRLYREFWVFTAPRGLTGVFQVTTLWIGTLLVGSLMDTAHASIYTASTRYLVAGQRRQHGDHPGDRAQALRAADGGGARAGARTSTRSRRAWLDDAWRGRCTSAWRCSRRCS